MTFSIADLFSTVTKDSLVDSITSVASTLGLLPTDWKSGDPELTIVQAVSQVFTSFWNS